MKFTINNREQERVLNWFVALEGDNLILRCSKDGSKCYDIITIFCGSGEGYLNWSLPEDLGLKLDNVGRLKLKL